MQELLEATDLRTLENVVSSIDPTILKLASDNDVLKLASSVGLSFLAGNESRLEVARRAAAKVRSCGARLLGRGVRRGRRGRVRRRRRR